MGFAVQQQLQHAQHRGLQPPRCVAENTQAKYRLCLPHASEGKSLAMRCSAELSAGLSQALRAILLQLARLSACSGVVTVCGLSPSLERS
eukprot:19227-Heterococcus_DN1.PRE.1